MGGRRIEYERGQIFLPFFRKIANLKWVLIGFLNLKWKVQTNLIVVLQFFFQASLGSYELCFGSKSWFLWASFLSYETFFFFFEVSYVFGSPVLLCRCSFERIHLISWIVLYVNIYIHTIHFPIICNMGNGIFLFSFMS